MSILRSGLTETEKLMDLSFDSLLRHARYAEHDQLCLRFTNKDIPSGRKSSCPGHFRNSGRLLVIEMHCAWHRTTSMKTPRRFHNERPAAGTIRSAATAIHLLQIPKISTASPVISASPCSSRTCMKYINTRYTKGGLSDLIRLIVMLHNILTSTGIAKCHFGPVK